MGKVAYLKVLMLISKVLVVPVLRVLAWIASGHIKYHQKAMSVEHTSVAVRLELHAAVALGP